MSGRQGRFDHRESREVKDMSLAAKIASITENRERRRTCLWPQWGLRSQRIERGKGYVSGHNDCFDHSESREVKDMSLATMEVSIKDIREW